MNTEITQKFIELEKEILKISTDNIELKNKLNNIIEELESLEDLLENVDGIKDKLKGINDFYLECFNWNR